MANLRWVGGAPARKQRTTITIANTWATADTVSVTINNKTLTVTIGSAFTVDDVAAALCAAINAADATTDLVGTESRNFGGQEIPEFLDVEAFVSGAVVSVYSTTAGVPFTMTASESTAGTGTATAATPTAATGPNHLDNAANYAGGALPVDNDALYIDQGAVSILYGLGYLRTNSIGLNVVVSNDYTGQIGLPPVNEAGYPEYRQRFLYLYGTKAFELNAGDEGNTDALPLYLDFQGANYTINLNVARNSDLSEPSVSICGSDGSGLGTVIKAGNVMIEPDDSGTTTPYDIGGLYIGVPGGNNADLVVYLGRRVTSGGSSAVSIDSGNVTFGCSLTTGGPVPLNGGVTRLWGPTDLMVYPDFDVKKGATLMPMLGTECGTVQVFAGGTLDCRETVRAFATSNGATAYPGAKVYDPAGKFLFNAATALLSLPGGRLNDIEHEFVADRTVDMTGAA
jgi:hypothetical protein